MDVTGYEADLAWRRALLESDDDVVVGDAADTLATTDAIAKVLQAAGPAAGAIEKLARHQPFTTPKPLPLKKKDDAKPKPFYVAHPWMTLGAVVVGGGLLGLLITFAVRGARK